MVAHLEDDYLLEERQYKGPGLMRIFRAGRGVTERTPWFRSVSNVP